MGCDIHLYKEKKVNGNWVTADSGWKVQYDDDDCAPDINWRDRFTDRDYDLFGFLSSGVRRDHKFSFQERGMPFNMCPEVKAVNNDYGVGGHSHSYLYLSELVDAWAFLNDKTVTVTGMKKRHEIASLQASIDSDEETNWDLLYPFCQGTNDTEQSEFSFEVPALLKLSGVKKIIDLFNDGDGWDQRIVFWFDN